MSVLKVGDKVSWRGAWGKQAAQIVVVESIDVNCVNKSGDEVDEVDWDDVDESVIVSLNNNHWAYGYQIDKI